MIVRSTASGTREGGRTGRRDSDVIEEALRRDLGLDLFETIRTRAQPVGD
jgi:hypothetical protein